MKNYALIVNKLDGILVEAYSKNDKKTLGKLMTEFKSNKKLKYLYALVDNLREGTVKPNEVNTFIKENIDVANTIDFSGFDRFITEELEKTSDELMENIGVLLFEKRNVLNLSKHNKAFDYVKNHLVELNTWKDDFKSKVDSFSEKIGELDSADKSLFESYIRTTPTKREEMFKGLVSECSQLIQNKINVVSDDETKLKLYEVKDKINSYEFNNEDYVQKMVTIHELKKELDENNNTK